VSTPYHAAYYAHELTRRSPSDSIAKLGLSLFNATVDLNPHQLDAALFSFRSPLTRGVILADEVGLGKTIEAALVVSQLWAERKRRILVIAPAILRKQWSQELADKFFLNSLVLESKEFNAAKKAGQSPFELRDKVVIASYHFAAAKKLEIAHVPWDLEIIDEANRPGSPIHFKEVVVGRDVGMERKVTVDVPSNLEAAITGVAATSPAATPTTVAPTEAEKAVTSTARPTAPAFTTPREKAVAAAALNAIHDLEREPDRVPNTTKLNTPEIQQVIAQKVAETLPAQQGELAFPEEEKPVDVAAVVAKVTELVINNTISIPHIVVVPKGEVTITFSPFKLDTGSISQQPVDQKILIQHLRTNLREFLDSGEDLSEEARLEDYLVRGLVDYDDISYDDHADLLYDLAGQVVQKLKSYLSDDEAVQNVLLYNQGNYVQLIRNQMQAHRVEQVAEYEAKASKGFETPRAVPFSSPATEQVRDFRVKPQPLPNIPKMLFGGFKRCLYPVQKFCSDPERRFAVLLEDEPLPLKWFKPAREQFKIFYRGGEVYEPDFVVETATAKYLCEPKRADNIDDPVVQAKARAAAEWCQHASQHETTHGGKPWIYLLIPHDAIVTSATLQGLAATYTYRPKVTSPASSRAPA